MKYFINKQFCQRFKQKIIFLDKAVEEKSKSLQKPIFLEFFEGITSLGSPVLIILAIAYLWKIGESLVAKEVVLGLLASGIAVGTIKKIIKRDRPPNHLDKVFSDSSFPSGHSTTAFMTATILTTHYNNSLLFFSLAAVVALSRVVLKDHYLSDVLAGSILGTTIGLVTLSLIL